MARPSNKDPLDKFRWSVSIDGFTRLGFAAVEVPTVSVTTNAYPEGGAHLFPRQIVDSVSYKPITLTRGVTSDKSFHEWAVMFIDLVRGFQELPKGVNGPANPASEYRRNVVIQHLDRAGRAVRTYTLYNAFPIEYQPASDFSADGDDTYSMEKLVLAYESFDVQTLGQDNNPFSVKDVAKRLIRRAF